jgi:hypothetical protein
MRLFFKKVALFLSPLLIGLILVNHWVDREYYPHYPLQYGEVFHPKVNANVVILGASHATHGINPKYLESDQYNVFNFALNGAPPTFNLEWYEKIFRCYYKKPRYVIYSVHWGMFDDHILRRQFEQDSPYFPFRFFIQEMCNFKKLKMLLLNRFALFRQRKQLLPRLLKKERREMFVVSKYYKGFIPYEITRNLSREEVIYPKNNASQIDAFLKLLDAFERDNIKVIFVQVPGYHPGYEPVRVLENVRLLKQMADERKIPFLDYDLERVSAINYESGYFSDVGHLNEKGSETFSELLKKDLEGLLL